MQYLVASKTGSDVEVAGLQDSCNQVNILTRMMSDKMRCCVMLRVSCLQAYADQGSDLE
jgi:hypothetical protein